MAEAAVYLPRCHVAKQQGNDASAACLEGFDVRQDLSSLAQARQALQVMGATGLSCRLPCMSAHSLKSLAIVLSDVQDTACLCLPRYAKLKLLTALLMLLYTEVWYLCASWPALHNFCGFYLVVMHSMA